MSIFNCSAADPRDRREEVQAGQLDHRVDIQTTCKQPSERCPTKGHTHYPASRKVMRVEKQEKKKLYNCNVVICLLFRFYLPLYDYSHVPPLSIASTAVVIPVCPLSLPHNHNVFTTSRLIVTDTFA